MLKTYFSEIRRTQRLWPVLILAVLAFGVPLIFQMLPRRQAAEIASALFVFIPLLLLIWEWRLNRRVTFYLLALAAFIVLLALPQALVRWMSTEESIAEVTFLGLKMAWLHRVSNLAYLGVLLAALWPRRRRAPKL